MALTLEKVPAAIQGIALGNAGLASLFLVLGKIYQKNDECVVVVYILAPVSLFFLLLYLGKTFLYPKAFMKDAASPTTNFTYGATAICLSLLSSFLALPQLRLHYKYGLVGVSAAAIFQIFQEVWFLYTCFRTHTGPQPFWNAACISISVTTITGVSVNMPLWVRQLSWFIALATMVLTMPPQIWSVLKHHRMLGGTGDPTSISRLNNNPTVAIMQASASILCSGWHAGSFKGSANGSVMHDAVGFVLFFTSMLFFGLTVVALVVRWKVVRTAITSQNPAVSALTFPFVITATAAAFFFKQQKQSLLLEVIVWGLFGLCFTLVVSVTAPYIKLLFFGDMLQKTGRTVVVAARNGSLGKKNTSY
mmetsp:Transcript_23522/g.37176  ORF Transcript_23522/g.37176 Transcript_23522/m.37176 type:complete len:363 (+) Transcript_23522:29-1117(+)